MRWLVDGNEVTRRDPNLRAHEAGSLGPGPGLNQLVEQTSCILPRGAWREQGDAEVTAFEAKTRLSELLRNGARALIRDPEAR
jgi:hypothetical protein